MTRDATRDRLDALLGRDVVIRTVARPGLQHPLNARHDHVGRLDAVAGTIEGYTLVIADPSDGSLWQLEVGTRDYPSWQVAAAVNVPALHPIYHVIRT